MDIKVKRKIKNLLDSEEKIMFRDVLLFCPKSIPGYSAEIGKNQFGLPIIYTFLKFNVLVSWLDAREIHTIHLV